MEGHLDVVKVLNSWNADLVHATDNEGRTPLWYAQHHPEVYQQLQKWGVVEASARETDYLRESTRLPQSLVMHSPPTTASEPGVVSGRDEELKREIDALREAKETLEARLREHTAEAQQRKQELNAQRTTALRQQREFHAKEVHTRITHAHTHVYAHKHKRIRTRTGGRAAQQSGVPRAQSDHRRPSPCYGARAEARYFHSPGTACESGPPDRKHSGCSVESPLSPT